MSRLESALEAFFSQQGVKFSKGGASFVLERCLNPGCRKEKHLYSRKATGRSICFKCGSKWDWRALVAAIAKVDRQHAHALLFGTGAGEELAREQGVRFDFESELEESSAKDRAMTLGPDFPPAESCDDALLYLASRRVLPEQVLQFDIRWNAAMRAVVFPIRRNGLVFGWQARRVAPSPGELRLISSRFNKSNFLLNWDRAALEPAIVVCEGPFDAVACDFEGSYGAVATLGKGVSLGQIQMLLSAPSEELYLALDPDAYDEVYELADRLNLRKRVYRARVPADKKDFGECDRGEVGLALRNAASLQDSAAYLEVHLN